MGLLDAVELDTKVRLGVALNRIVEGDGLTQAVTAEDQADWAIVRLRAPARFQ
jgi:hypothetical protein